MAKTSDNALVVGAAAAAVTGAVIAANVLTPKRFADTAFDRPSIARFLTQCTFGVTDADIDSVLAFGSYDAWLADQMDPVKHPYFDTLAWVNQRLTKQPGVEKFTALEESFWIAIRNPDVVTTDPVTKVKTTTPGTHTDLLRQRMKFALSQLFVISETDGELQFGQVDATIHYWDLLDRNAFVNFRTLLDSVAYAPAMGKFLSYIENLKEDPVTGLHPDENFARELMQLFTLGTVLLNQDGTIKPKLDAAGNPILDADGNITPIPTYTHDDIAGLSMVLTGMSWASKQDFFSSDSSGSDFVTPMAWYPEHHSTSQKSFLGVTIPAGSLDGPGDLKIALDTIFAHPNLPPFLATRLIKSFVTSNPSPAYVTRVAGVFIDNGNGVRGDMAAVVRAVLLDNEARDPAGAQANPNFGKLREPIIRVANWIRSFQAKSKNGFFDVHDPYNENQSNLQQQLLFALSVFNFWKPTYVPPQTSFSDYVDPVTHVKGLTAPEFQVVNELSTSSYLNFIQQMIGSGVGVNWKTFQGFDVSSDYTVELPLASTPAALLDRLNLLLFYGSMSTALRNQIIAAVNKITISATSPATGQRNRVKLAVFLSMSSGEYLAQV